MRCLLLLVVVVLSAIEHVLLIRRLILVGLSEAPARSHLSLLVLTLIQRLCLRRQARILERLLASEQLTLRVGRSLLHLAGVGIEWSLGRHGVLPALGEMAVILIVA